MTLLADIEDRVLKIASDTLACYFGDDAVSVAAGPYEWSGAYMQRIIHELPAVRLVFTGGASRDGTALSLDTIWTLYVVTGWQGGDESTRRRSNGGAYRIVEILLRTLHNTLVEDAGLLRVDTVENITEEAWEDVGIAVYGIDLELEITFDPEELPTKPFDDFLRARIDYDLDDDGVPEAEDHIDLPQ